MLILRANRADAPQPTYSHAMRHGALRPTSPTATLIEWAIRLCSEDPDPVPKIDSTALILTAAGPHPPWKADMEAPSGFIFQTGWGPGKGGDFEWFLTPQ